jgi:hypothetical protein
VLKAGLDFVLASWAHALELAHVQNTEQAFGCPELVMTQDRSLAGAGLVKRKPEPTIRVRWSARWVRISAST